MVTALRGFFIHEQDELATDEMVPDPCSGAKRSAPRTDGRYLLNRPEDLFLDFSIS